MRILGLPRQLLACGCGAMAVETAIVAPVLALLSIGTFEVGTMVSRQQELQSAASEAESIILGGARTELDLAVIEEVIEASMDLKPQQVSLEPRWRCHDTAGPLVKVESACDEEIGPVYNYVLLQLEDRYNPVWTNFGVGSGIDYNIDRTILIR